MPTLRPTELNDFDLENDQDEQEEPSIHRSGKITDLLACLEIALYTVPLAYKKEWPQRTSIMPDSAFSETTMV